MAETTGIGWTEATNNFWIGCTHVGTGCGEMIAGKQIGCYAEVFANRKFNLKFGPGERRHRTKSGYENPLKWQRMHERAAAAGERAMMTVDHKTVPVPQWVFCNSLSDFFDNEIDPQWRVDAWAVIKATPLLRWQIVTKRGSNVPDMLPDDWNGGVGYEHVGIIVTMVNQKEVDRDYPRLMALKELGVKWVGISIEPQLGRITLTAAIEKYGKVDWVIGGGESTQGDHPARAYDLAWPEQLITECAAADVPYFQKQMGDHPIQNSKRVYHLKKAGSDPSLWAPGFRVQQMPRIYDGEAKPVPKTTPPQPDQASLF